MKRLINQLLLTGVFALILVSCKKDEREIKYEVPQSVLDQIKEHGFSNQNVQKVGDAYLVEGDILLTEEELSEPTPGTPNLIIAKEEHYRTFNLVNTAVYPVIKVALKNSSAQHQAAFSAALDVAIARYNAEGLTVSFQRVSGGKANITINSFYQLSNVLGSSGFPTSKGAPYNNIQMNTFWYSTGTDQTNVNYLATIMAHEMGHCIGYRHTDYANRSYSCGGTGGNEGAGTVGAVYINGTPTGGDPNSWMLACIGDNQNRPFNANDKIALANVY